MSALYAPECLLAFCALAYLLGACWFVAGMRRRPGNANIERVPLASVVVAARDEAAHIACCLRALLAQDYPPERCEIIVVDDGSTDGTGRIVREFSGETTSVRVLRTKGSSSKKAALSLGIAEARGEVILTTDADCQVAPGWISGMLSHFADGVGMVIGFSQIGSPSEIKGWRQGYEAVDFTCLMACIWGSAGWGHPMAASGQNLAFLREAFFDVGGYEKVMHRASGDDVLLMQTMRRSGRWSIVFANQPATFVRHPVAGSWGGLFGQRSRWASNAPILARLDPLFFGYMLLTYVLSWATLMAPLLCLTGALDPLWTLGAMWAKVWAEWGIFNGGIVLAGRRELRRYFPLWALLQPLHVVLVGSLGCLGIFRWKGRVHLWGRRVRGAGTGVGLSEPSRR